jgi:hypothetical protein
MVHGMVGKKNQELWTKKSGKVGKKFWNLLII